MARLPTILAAPADFSPRGELISRSLRCLFSLSLYPSQSAWLTSLIHRCKPSRAREIQAQEGVPGLPLNPWGGPPTSGNSTPLRENIPESPTDGFPDFAQLPTPDSLPQTRRTRAGTLPSRFSPGGAPPGLVGLPNLAVKSARQTPSQTPYNKTPSPGLEPVDSSTGGSSLLSRLRAGSLPQRSQFAPLPGTTSPFGPSIFSSWNPSGMNRERGSTLASIASVGSNGPSSPAQSQYSSNHGTGESDVHMRTLDYLGLAETPQPTQAQLATPYLSNLDAVRSASRVRSLSVNNQNKYADDDLDDAADAFDEGSTQYALQLQNQLAETQAAIHNHNLAVKAFASQTRRRAQTTGGVDGRLGRPYIPGNGVVPSPLGIADTHTNNREATEDLPQAVANLNLGASNARNAGLLGVDEQGLEGPTSALWLGSIPTSTTISTLTEMFKQHGHILSARVLTHKNCGFVNFKNVESAVSAKASMNGREIFPGAGPIRINFAKPASGSNTPGGDGAYPSPSPDPFGQGEDMKQSISSGPVGDNLTIPISGTKTPTLPSLQDLTSEVLNIVAQFGASEEDRQRISRNLNSATQYTSYVEEIPPIREPAHTRVHDAPKLREIRKRIDNQGYSQSEIESIALDMLPEIAELSSDYLGNTVVQKLFEHCSDQVRDAMLLEIAPHLAEIGVHKNGTWAAQKIIEVCKTHEQRTMIVEHIRPYTVPLFLDQYGNYVLQGCLKFGAPYNDYIFEAMISRMWEIAQGRYGARAMRACLESHHANKDQQRMLAAAIALYSVQLATNANGALLLTWFLDTCTFPQRRTVLSPQIVPCLVQLCTHKVAYLTVLKIINQKAEPEARDTILKAMFFTPNDQVLEAILNDHACGATLIFKVLTTPFFDESIRNQVVETVKSVLLRIKAQPAQGYKRLMDEVGLSTRTSGSNSRDPSAPPDNRQRPSSRQANMNGHHNQASKPFFNPLNPSPNAQGYEASLGPQSGGTPDAAMAPFPAYNSGFMFNPANGGIPPGMNLNPMQYQQGMMGRGAPQMSYNYPQMGSGYPAYGNGGPQMDQYRQGNGHNGNGMQAQNMPGMAGGQPYAPPGFGMPAGAYGAYGNGQGVQGMGYAQQEPGNNRRGRVSASREQCANLVTED